MENLETLNKTELLLIEGGSKLSDAVCWLLGAMFACPAYMALNGAAAHEIMGSK